MTQRLRPFATLVGILLPVVLLSGCGGEEPVDAQPYLVTDLGGETAAPGSVPTSAPTTSSRPTRTPTRTPTSQPTKQPTKKPEQGPRGAPTKGELIAQVGAAVGQVSTVHIDVGDAVGPPSLVMDVDYGSGALDVRVPPATPGSAEVELRRVGGQLYFDLGDGDGWQRVSRDDPRVVDNSSGVLAQIVAFDLLADLRTTLVEGVDYTKVGRGDLEGTTVDFYSLTLDVARLLQPSLLVKEATSGEVAVVIAVGPDSRPVRIDYGDEPGAISSLRFSAWGAPVSVPVPPVS